ncbi:flagellar biosynthetic protein FliO [Kineococcus sp. T13]|uniref:flagellar biosynthetic protein FliO n=1 Tax=Kineococcus vitellinus TaxID=2696565 RepID=UPI0014130F3C|nr:flagellar biosynthetic protein FliO [Kineococcus vitellinus]NAZ76704.1 flagellar biosynthetic protein FliO [Kineococcus vitellinus]
MDAVAAIARTSFSLVAVLGLLYLISRWLRRRGGVGAAGAAEFAVLARQSLGAKASVALVKVGERALVVGVTEQGVSLLGETDVATVLPQAEAAGTDETAEAAEAAGPAAVDGVDVRDRTTDQSTGPALPGAGERYVRRDGETVAVKARHASPAAGGINGSALSPATWTKAVDVLRERTTRR